MDFQRIFEGRALVKPVEVGAAIGWSEQYCRNLMHKGKFPFPVVQVGGVRFCRVSELDQFIQKRAAEARLQAEAAGGVPRRGRMTKLEKKVQEELAALAPRRSRNAKGGEQ